MAKENGKSQGSLPMAKTQEVLLQRAVTVLKLLQLLGTSTSKQIIDESVRRATERTISGLNFLLQNGLVEEKGGALEISDLGRIELGLPPKENRRLKIPDEPKDFERLVVHVLAVKRHETNYSLERLIADVYLLAERFGYLVSSMPRTYLGNEIGREVQLLAGRKVPGQPSLQPASPPQIEITREDGEHIRLLY